MIDGFRFRLASARTDISRLGGSLRKSIAAELLAGPPLIEFPRYETEPNVSPKRETFLTWINNKNSAAFEF